MASSNNSSGNAPGGVRATGNPNGFEAKMATATIKWSMTERVRLYERLQRFVEHDIAIDDAFAKMILRTNRPRGMLKSRNAMRHVYQRWYAGLRRGKKFTDPEVAGSDLPPGELIMLMMGDQTSSPAEGFRQARFVADVVRRMKSALIGALIYPAVLLLMACGFLAGIAYKFGPQMLDMTDKPVEAWTFLPRMLYTLSVVVKNFGIPLGILAIAFFALALWSMPRWHRMIPKLRWFCDHYIPPWSIYREYNASSFLIALGSMVQASLPVDDAIARITAISSPWLQAHLRRMLVRVRRGDDPGQSFDTGLLSDETLGYLEDFNSAGGLDAALTVVGTESVEESIKRVQAGALVMGIFGMVLVVGLILLIYGGMIGLGMMIYTDSRSPG